jgi:N-acyl-D-amino-acid deacylase
MRLLQAVCLLGALALPRAQAPAPAWPDTYQARVEALALMQTLNAEILASRSATRSLEAWCRDRGLADDPSIAAYGERGAMKAPSTDQLQRLQVTNATELRYRRVRLSCGTKVLSEADNWYVPSRLTPAMNTALETTDAPFGRVVAPLEPYRRTLDMRVLWSPLPAQWRRGAAVASAGGALAIPSALFEHRAVLYTRDHTPFSEVVETYQRDILGAPPAPSTVIRTAVIVDGTGAPGRRGDVRIAGDRIVEIGQLTPADGEPVVDAGGLTLAPGFIDTHSHHDRGLETSRDGLAMVSQGVTTIVIGQDGGGAGLAALFAGYESRPVAVNVASYAGHGEVRERVMGTDFARQATADEIDRMKVLVQAEMDAGALGLSTGLEYDPGIYSSPEEVRVLAKVAGDAGGRYISHIRSEDRDFWQALDEVVAIGRENHMPVQVSHIKLGMRDLWGQAEKALAVLDRARAEGVDITADIYPYTYWQSNLGVLYPKRNFGDPVETDFVLAHVSGPGDIIFNRFRAHPDYTGKTLADVAALRGTTPARTLMDLLAEPDGPDAGIVARGMADADVERLIQWRFANVCSDGVSSGLHPRGFGSFSKVIGPYVRDKKLFPIEEAVRKTTSLAAGNVGIRDRGRIAPGYFADLVLFDPATVADRADFGRAQAQAVGIHTVWVNGQVVFRDGATTSIYAGRPLRREPAR